jgi:tetratricopeptide (TPR) repeat protein
VEQTPEDRQRSADADLSRARGWGGVARKGAVNLRSEGEELRDQKSRRAAPEPVPEWTRDEVVAPVRERTPTAYRPSTLPGDIQTQIRRAFIGTATQRERTVTTLGRAVEAYDRHRYEEAARLARSVASVVPGVAAVRELAGLAAYRSQRWVSARAHLRAHFEITGDAQHLPQVMDSERAQGRFRAVASTYEDIVNATPTADVLAEARIVMASALADQNKYQESIALLQKAGAAKNLRNPSYRHLRMWYALADAYDRAGDTAGARELFARVVLVDPDAYDARSRLDDLGAPPRPRKRKVAPVSAKRLAP